MHRHTFGRALIAALTLAAMLSQGTWVLAGTTGGLGGTVSDAATGAPVAGAKVTVSSASQTASTVTDNTGHYTFLSLAPDTYVVSVDKGGYDRTSEAGVTVFADVQGQFNVKLAKLKTIAKITSRSMGSLIKSGATSDTYSVNATTASKAAVLGGGGNLDNAYSAIASVPGVVVPAGGMGWNQAVYIRGSQSFFSGYEYDGVPVNRAFDNYDSSTESNLGLQELQVYTGGGPASNSSAGTAGFINQVIKTGTYPGFADFAGTLSGPQFYHMAKIEAGGANPNRTFSYYAGLSGYDSSPRVFDNNNGAGLFTPNAAYGYVPAYTVTDQVGGTNGYGLLPLCNADGSTPASMAGLPWYGADGFTGVPAAFGAYGPGGNTCLYDLSAAANVGNVSTLTDRENVVNLHFAIPRKNDERDDVQLLWSASAFNTEFYSSLNDMGAQSPGGLNAVMLAATGGPYCPATPTASTSPYCGTGANYTFYPGLTTPAYIDAPGTYNLPFGTPIAPNGVCCAPTETYYQPSSAQGRAANAALPANLRDTFHNDTGILKAQWTHPFSENAFARIFAYTFFSDWTQAGAADTWSDYAWGIGGPTAGAIASNYDLITHTAGGEFQFLDQLTPAHLLNFTANYTRANTMRFNNYGYVLSYFNGGSPIGLVSKDSGGIYHCWDPTSGNEEACQPGTSWEAYGSNPTANPSGTYSAVGNAAAAGAQWETLWNGDASGPKNTVIPKFAFVSLTDEWRPNDKLLLNAGLRYENYDYGLSPATPGTDFYAQIIKNDLCVNGAGTVYTNPLKPGQAPPAKPIYTLTCPAGYAHPNFSSSSPSSYVLADLSPRFSLTYTQNPYTVWRFSAGRFTEPPISASVQYLGAAGDATTVWGATLPLGFTSPFHPIPAMSATQADLSFEHQLRGTDLSVKISPFFNDTQGYQEQSFIGTNFVTQAPVGQFRSDGVEFALNKGDFRSEGFSGQLSLTFTDAKVQYQNKYYGANQIATANTAIAQFNSLTSACGGNAVPAGAAAGTIVNGCIAGETPASACYSPAAGGAFGTPEACSVAGAISNPYYNMAKQPLLDPNGWYAPSDVGLSPTSNPTTTYYDAPIASALILNYRHGRFDVTPSIQVVEGSSYGGPMDFTGVDPRACGQNSAAAGITTVSPNTNPNQCDYLSMVSPNGATYAQSPSLYIPDPQTGTFAKPGAYRNPNLFLANLMLSYDVSPKVTATVTLANLYHTCFGGSREPWTNGIFAPNRNVCGYGPAGVAYASNFYNGTGPSDSAANGTSPYPWQLQSYLPRAGSDAFAVPNPFNAYFQLQIRL